MTVENIPFSDMAEKIAQEHLLSTVIIIAVERNDLGTRFNWGYEGSYFEAIGAASKFVHDITEEEKKSEEGGEL